MHEPNLAIVPRTPIREESAEYHLFSKIDRVMEKLAFCHDEKLFLVSSFSLSTKIRTKFNLM